MFLKNKKDNNDLVKIAALLVHAAKIDEIYTTKEEEIIEKGDYSKFYMHRIGHWLGMDVHDVGSYKTDGDWRQLEKGMVLTIEPGIYILDSLDGIDDKWKGIGVRIEDDIVITDKDFEILTPDIPRTIEEVEQTVLG